MCEFCSVLPFSAKREQYDVVNECATKIEQYICLHNGSQRTYVNPLCTFTLKLHFSNCFFCELLCKQRYCSIFVAHSFTTLYCSLFAENGETEQNSHTSWSPTFYELFYFCQLYQYNHSQIRTATMNFEKLVTIKHPIIQTKLFSNGLFELFWAPINL